MKILFIKVLSLKEQCTLPERDISHLNMWPMQALERSDQHQSYT